MKNQVYFSVAEIATILGYNTESVRRWTRPATSFTILGSEMHGRELRISEDHLRKFHEEKGWDYEASPFPELAEAKRAAKKGKLKMLGAAAFGAGAIVGARLGKTLLGHDARAIGKEKESPKLELEILYLKARIAELELELQKRGELAPNEVGQAESPEETL